MSRATLAVILSKLKAFDKPNTTLEQYPTPSEAAATALWDAHIRGLLDGKEVLDLGAGTGILGIGAMILGARVTFIDIDKRVSNQIEANIKLAEKEAEVRGTYSIKQADVTTEELPRADLVISNPPFGTKQKHADKEFLKAAYEAADEHYTFHKTATISHLREWTRQQGVRIVQEFPFTFQLPKTMKQHEKKTHEVTITCLHTRKDL